MQSRGKIRRNFNEDKIYPSMEGKLNIHIVATRQFIKLPILRSERKLLKLKYAEGMVPIVDDDMIETSRCTIIPMTRLLHIHI